MKNEPKIRIKGFERAWEKACLKDISQKVIEKNSDLKYKITLTNSAEYGVIDQLEFFDHKISNGDNIRNYYVVRNGDFVYNPRISVTAPVGPINQSQLGYTGVMSPLYYVFRIHDIDAEYLRYFFKTNLWHPYLKGNGNSGARFDRLSITDELFVRMPISLPVERKEQRAIATYFRHIDSLIETADKKLASLKQVKEASLQSMFPKEGQKVPEVRFKGFDGEWKTSKLSTFAKRVTRKNGNLETELPVTISSQDGIIAQTQFFNSVVASSNLRGYYLIKKGEFAYNKSYSNGYPYGSVKRLEKYDMGALSTLYIVFALSKDIDHDYVIYFFETMLWHNEVAMRAAEGARNHGLLNIGADDFLDIQIIVPPILSEQRKIASFFVHLDKQIAIAQQRLDLLRRIKSACLDEMFV